MQSAHLVVSAIILWNSVYLSRIVDRLRADGQGLPDDVICHISPQIWEHINLARLDRPAPLGEPGDG